MDHIPKESLMWEALMHDSTVVQFASKHWALRANVSQPLMQP